MSKPLELTSKPSQFSVGDRIEHAPVYAAHRGTIGVIVRQHPSDLKYFYVHSLNDGLFLWHESDMTLLPETTEATEPESDNK